MADDLITGVAHLGIRVHDLGFFIRDPDRNVIELHQYAH